MEKAHPDVLELFFQVFDKGVMEDGEGVPIDFKEHVDPADIERGPGHHHDVCQGGRRPEPEALIERLRPAL